MYYRGTMPRTGSDDGKVRGGGGALPVEERVEADGTVYIVTKTKRGREVKTLKSKWEQEQASIARKKALKEKSLLRQKERGAWRTNTTASCAAFAGNTSARRPSSKTWSGPSRETAPRWQPRAAKRPPGMPGKRAEGRPRPRRTSRTARPRPTC